MEEKAKIFEQIHQKDLFRSFGKVTIGGKSYEQNNETDEETKVKSEEEKATDMYEEPKERAEKELSEIRLKEGKVGTIYEAARRIRGGKKNEIKPTAINNPETGELAVTREGIKSVTLRYCVATLKNNTPEPGFEFGSQIKDQLHTQRMKLKDGEFGVWPETFEKVVMTFKLSNKRSYDFLTKAGQKFQQLCQKNLKSCFVKNYSQAASATWCSLWFSRWARRAKGRCCRTTGLFTPSRRFFLVYPKVCLWSKESMPMQGPTYAHSVSMNWSGPDNGVETLFSGSQYEIGYGGVEMGPLQF